MVVPRDVRRPRAAAGDQTLSTQGSGVIAIQCAAGKSTVLVGLNRPELRPRPDAPALSVEVQLGTGERRTARAVRTSEDTIELDERASAEILAQAAEVASFAIHLRDRADADTALIFRPVETRQAIGRLQEACRWAP